MVIRAAQAIGGVSMPCIATPALREQMTPRMRNLVMDSEALIINIGQDPTRAQRGSYYLIELEGIVQRGYTNVIELLVP